MKLCGAKVWIYLTGLDMGDLTWMRPSRMPLVWQFMHNFWKSWGKIFFRKIWPISFCQKKRIRYGRMPLVWKWMHDFWKSWFFLKKDDDDDLFLKINEAWPNAPSLQIDEWLLKTLIFFRKCDLKKKKKGWGIAKCT